VSDHSAILEAVGFQYDDLPRGSFTVTTLPSGLLRVRAVRDGGIVGEGSGDDADHVLQGVNDVPRQLRTMS
jgi:hypothetical protein